MTVAAIGTTSLTTTAPRITSAIRMATNRRYLMCEPRHFAVSYAINPWMDPSVPVDIDLAVRQWRGLVETYRSLGHEVLEIEPISSSGFAT